MTKEEVIKEIEEYIQEADKCISEDKEYIRGWKSALLVALELMTKLTRTDESCNPTRFMVINMPEELK